MKAWNWMLAKSPAPVWGAFLTACGYGLASMLAAGLFAPAF